MIKHIVLNGGAYLGLLELGALYTLQESKFYELINIETIYGTSIGGFIGALLCLKMNWNDILEYFIMRPWHKLFNIKPQMILDVIQSKGLLNKDIIKGSFENLLQSQDLSIHITLKEFYDFSQIELHLFTIQLNSFKLVDLSYKTHPDLELIDAIYMTCAIPYIFEPAYVNGEFYIDGGLMCSYPLEHCVNNNKELNEILAFRLKSTNKSNKITNESNIFEYAYYLHSMICKNEDDKEIIIPYEVIIHCNELNIRDGYELLTQMEKREDLIEKGKEYGKLFLSYTKNK